MDALNADESATLAIQPDVYSINANTILRLAEEDQSVFNARRGDLARATSSEYQYRIGPQDSLRVTVWDHPELNNPGAIAITPFPQITTDSGATVSSMNVPAPVSADIMARLVNDDGTMFYPYVGNISVAGKTTEEIRAFLVTMLRKTIRDPQVEVVVASYRSKKIYVTGNVKNPGTVPISDVPVTVADAVAGVGGATSDANISDVTISRAGHHLSVDLYELLYHGDMTQNIRLEPGDVINVPEQRFNKVFVLGEISRPASIPMPRGMYTLTEALSDSGGISQITAQASQIYVIRGTPLKPQIFRLDATRPDALILADHFNLHPRDVIFVDAAPIARFARIVNQILPSLQALQAGKYIGQ